jgi:hypothetical protein
MLFTAWGLACNGSFVDCYVKVKWQKRSFFDCSFVKEEPLAFHWKTIQKECIVAFLLFPNPVNSKTLQLLDLDAICKEVCGMSSFTRPPTTITDLTCEAVKTRGMLCQPGNCGLKSLTRRETVTQ